MHHLLAVFGTDDCAMSFHCRQNSKCAISRISLEFSTFWAELGFVQAKLSNLNSEGHLGSSRALLLNMGRAKLLTGIFVDFLGLMDFFYILQIRLYIEWIKRKAIKAMFAAMIEAIC